MPEAKNFGLESVFRAVDGEMRATTLKTTIAAVGAALALSSGPAPHASASAEHRPLAASYVPGELVVGRSGGGSSVLTLPAGTEIADAIVTLERRDGVAYAHPNWIARAAGFQAPYDKGSAGVPGGWRAEQWNLLGKPGGVRAPGAWRRLARAGAPGGAGVTVAVVDSGLAYAAAPGHAPSPDFAADQFVAGIDLVDDDDQPLDENGHGTHVAGTIAEQVTLGEPAPAEDYLTGLAFGARLMAVRVLDASGAGTAADVADGILWAARHGADVINVSLQLPAEVRSCADVPDLCRATRKAEARGALVVASAGNTDAGGEARALFPGAAPGVLAVGASTEHGCLASYSRYGARVDLLAPGGGVAGAVGAKPRCAEDAAPIRQLSFECFRAPACESFTSFSIRPDLGTSMAAAHASGAAALVEASGLLGADPGARELTARLECSAREAKPKRLYGAGLLDASRAVDRRNTCG